MASLKFRPRITELKMTSHANARRQQRGIAGGVMEAVLAFGVIVVRGRSAVP